jgi:hypothetical protein
MIIKNQKTAKQNANFAIDNTYEKYLIMVGIRSCEYTYDDETLFNHIEYFKKCQKAGFSAYKALLFLDDYMNGDYVF